MPNKFDSRELKYVAKLKTIQHLSKYIRNQCFRRKLKLYKKLDTFIVQSIITVWTANLAKFLSNRVAEIPELSDQID